MSFILQALQVRRSRTKTVILLQSVLLKRLQAFFHHHLRLQKKRRHLPVNLLLTTSARRRHHLRQPIRFRLTASHQPRRQAPNKPEETSIILTRKKQERILNNKMTATKSSIQIRMLLFCCYQPFISLKYLHSKLNGHVSHFGFRARH